MLFPLFFVVLLSLLPSWYVRENGQSIDLWTSRSAYLSCKPTSPDVGLRPAPGLLQVHIIHQMAGRCGDFYRPRPRRSLSTSLIALLLLISGVESNPGPSIKMGCLNARSIVHKGPLITDLIETHHLDVLAICETWIVASDPDTVKRDAAPKDYVINHVTRPKATVNARGGGLCLISRSSIVVKQHQLQLSLSYDSFECQLLTMFAGSISSSEAVTVVII